MSKPQICVLLLTYHPQKQALMATLRSIAFQEDCAYELIVADDGSGAFFEEDIRAFCAENGVQDLKILAHKENKGTVQNILSGVREASAPYIKPISPGDLLYDAHTLRDCLAFMRKHDAKAAFGKLVFYNYDTRLQVKPLAHPARADAYRADAPYSHRRAVRRQMVYGDFICGASAVYERNAFLHALETITPAVRYAEDAVFQLFALEEIRIFAWEPYIVWYEHDTGISAAAKGGFTRIDTDFYNFYGLLAEKYPQSRPVQDACRRWKLRKSGTAVQRLLFKLRPDRFLFSLRLRLKKPTCPPCCADFFRRCREN